MINKIIDKLTYRDPQEYEITKDDLWYCFNNDCVMNNLQIDDELRSSMVRSLSIAHPRKRQLIDTTMMLSYSVLTAIREASTVPVASLESYSLLMDDLNKKADVYFSHYACTSVSTFLYLHPILTNSGVTIIDSNYNIDHTALKNYITNLTETMRFLVNDDNQMREAIDLIRDDRVVTKVLTDNLVELKALLANPLSSDSGERYILNWLPLFYDDGITESEFFDFILDRVFQEQLQAVRRGENCIIEPDYTVTRNPVIHKEYEARTKPSDPKQYFRFLAKTQRKPANAIEEILSHLGLVTLTQAPIGLAHTELLSNVNIVGCTGSGSTLSAAILFENVLRENNGGMIVISGDYDDYLHAMLPIYTEIVMAKRYSDLIMCNLDDAMDFDFDDIINENKIIIMFNDCGVKQRASHESIDKLTAFFEKLSKQDAYFDNMPLFNIDICAATSTERFIYVAEKHIKALNAKGMGLINVMSWFGAHKCELTHSCDLLRMNTLFRTQLLMKTESAPDWLCMIDENHVRSRSRSLHPGGGMLFVNGEFVLEGNVIYHSHRLDDLNVNYPYIEF